MISVATAPAAAPASYTATPQPYATPSVQTAYAAPPRDAATFSNTQGQAQAISNPFKASGVMATNAVQPKFGFLPDAGIFTCGVPAALCCCCCALPFLLIGLLAFH